MSARIITIIIILFVTLTAVKVSGENHRYKFSTTRTLEGKGLIVSVTTNADNLLTKVEITDKLFGGLCYTIDLRFAIIKEAASSADGKPTYYTTF